MMQSDNFIQVGYIKSAHSLKGEVFVRLRAGEADWLDHFDKIYIRLRGKKEIRSLEVEKFRPHKDGLIVLTKGVSDRNGAEALRGHEVLAPKDWLTSEPGENIYLAEVLHFQVYDQEGRHLGEIKSFLDAGSQDLVVIKNKETGEKGELPWIEEFLEKLDFENQKVHMKLPDSLWEMVCEN